MLIAQNLTLTNKTGATRPDFEMRIYVYDVRPKTAGLPRKTEIEPKKQLDRSDKPLFPVSSRATGLYGGDRVGSVKGGEMSCESG